MRNVLAIGLVCSLVGLAPCPGSTAEAQTGPSPPAAPAIVQNRDEPGRNPYQESANAKPPSGTNQFWSVTFSKVPGGRRRVIEHVACLIIDAPTIGFVFLTDQNSRLTRDYLPWTTVNLGDYVNVIINANTLLYYFYNDQPSIRFQMPSGNFDCTIVGYDVPIP